MLGNVYVKFVHEEDADKCVKELENRWYNLKLIPIYSQISVIIIGLSTILSYN